MTNNSDISFCNELNNNEFVVFYDDFAGLKKRKITKARTAGQKYNRTSKLLKKVATRSQIYGNQIQNETQARERNPEKSPSWPRTNDLVTPPDFSGPVLSLLVWVAFFHPGTAEA